MFWLEEPVLVAKTQLQTLQGLLKKKKKIIKKSGFVATNTAVGVPTSCPEYLLFVTTNTAGDGSRILSKAASGVLAC